MCLYQKYHNTEIRDFIFRMLLALLVYVFIGIDKIKYLFFDNCEVINEAKNNEQIGVKKYRGPEASEWVQPKELNY